MVAGGAAVGGRQASPPGMDSFVERLEEGRRRRHEQYAKLYATGSNWTGETTVPQEGLNHPRGGSTSSAGLGGGTTGEVRSLRPPVGPGNLSRLGLSDYA